MHGALPCGPQEGIECGQGRRGGYKWSRQDRHQEGRPTGNQPLRDGTTRKSMSRMSHSVPTHTRRCMHVRASDAAWREPRALRAARAQHLQAESTYGQSAYGQSAFGQSAYGQNRLRAMPPTDKASTGKHASGPHTKKSYPHHSRVMIFTHMPSGHIPSNPIRTNPACYGRTCLRATNIENESGCEIFGCADKSADGEILAPGHVNLIAYDPRAENVR